MPKIKVSQDKLEGLPPLPVGRYTVRLDGFKPKKSKNSDSTNLNAQLAIINHPTLNDRKIINNANTNFSPSLFDMSHALGVKYENEGVAGVEAQFPGEFQCKVHGDSCDGSDPENWNYIGPLAGQVGEVEIVEADNGKGGKTTKIGRFICRVQGCTRKHSENLAGS